MVLEQNKLKNILEAALLAVARPMSVEQLTKLFAEDEQPSVNDIKDAIKLLQIESESRGVELKEIASGYRYQAKQEYSEWLSRLWEEKPAKYSRAALETLALIAYRQPVTRAEIEDVRGVGVSSSIIKTMLEREWIRVVGHRDVPGRPALYATTKQFLDYFNMKSLDELPTLAEIKDLEDLHPELDLPNPDDERENSLRDDSDKRPDTDADDQVDLVEAIEMKIKQDEQLNNEQAGLESVSAEFINLEQPNSSEEHDELDDIHTESNHDRFYAEPDLPSKAEQGSEPSLKTETNLEQQLSNKSENDPVSNTKLTD